MLDIRGFNLNDKLEIDPAFLAGGRTPRARRATAATSTYIPNTATTATTTTTATRDDIAAFVFKSTRPFDPARLDDFLGSLVNVFGPRMLRYKGVLLMEGADRKVVFQGVHQIMGSDIGGKWGEDEERGSKMVFIRQELCRKMSLSTDWAVFGINYAGLPIGPGGKAEITNGG